MKRLSIAGQVNIINNILLLFPVRSQAIPHKGVVNIPANSPEAVMVPICMPLSPMLNRY
jgi:hypothetical protein